MGIIMKYVGALLISLFLLIQDAAGQVVTSAQQASDSPVSGTHIEDEQLFTRLVGEVSTSIEHKDMKALSELMAPDYTHYDPSGSVSHEAEELTYLATWPPTSIKLVGTVQVSRTGNMAVTVSRSLYSFTENDKTTNRTIQHMIAWTLHRGKWQMAIVQSKEIAA